MTQEFDTFELKGQANRLQKSLAAIGKPVTRIEALNVIAQLQGKRDWKELTGLLDVQKAVKKNVLETDKQWLHRLQYTLMMSGIFEGELDDLIHDMFSSKKACSINNQGMQCQLQALLEEFGLNKKAVLLILEETFSLAFAFPEGTGTEPIMPATVSICEGFPEETVITVDIFDWALQASADDLQNILFRGLSNNELTDDVGLWLEKNATNITMRNELHQMLELMRQVIAVKPDRTGTLESARLVQLDGTQSGQDALAGNLIGGFASSSTSGGKSKVLLSAQGAQAGAGLGMTVEQDSLAAQAMELIIRTDNGEFFAIVQELSRENFSEGQRVRIVSDGGRIRVARMNL